MRLVCALPSNCCAISFQRLSGDDNSLLCGGLPLFWHTLQHSYQAAGPTPPPSLARSAARLFYHGHFVTKPERSWIVV